MDEERDGDDRTILSETLNIQGNPISGSLFYQLNSFTCENPKTIYKILTEVQSNIVECMSDFQLLPLNNRSRKFLESIK